ncbi:MAG: hypothetical protein OCD76_02790 [Reichenbachiella sp.]
MKLLILKTDITTLIKRQQVQPIMQNQSAIHNWWVDMQDIDHVMRIEAEESLDNTEFIKLINEMGIHCEELPD